MTSQIVFLGSSYDEALDFARGFDEEPPFPMTSELRIVQRFNRLLLNGPKVSNLLMENIDLNSMANVFAVERINRFTHLHKLELKLAPGFQVLNFNAIAHAASLKKVLLDVNGSQLGFAVEDLQDKNCLVRLDKFVIKCRLSTSGERTTTAIREILKRAINLLDLEIEVDRKGFFAPSLNEDGSYSVNVNEMPAIFSGEHVDLLSHQTRIQSLILTNTNVDDDILKATDLPLLKCLRVYDRDSETQVSEIGIRHMIANLPNLRNLWWDDSAMTLEIYVLMRRGFKQSLRLNDFPIGHYPLDRFAYF